MSLIGDLFVKLGLKSDEYNKGLDDAQKKAGSFGSAIGNIFKNIANSMGLGGVVSQFESVTSGIGSFYTSLKTASGGASIFKNAMTIIKGALVSTGIGAVVVVFGALVSYFTATERGAEQLERGLAGLKAIFGVLVDRASAFGEGMVMIFSGKFQDGWDRLKGSVKGVGAEMNSEVSTAMQLAARLQELEDRERGLVVSLEERRAKAALLRQQAKEEGVTADEKKQKLVEAASIYKSIFKDEKSIETERASILEAQINLGEKRDDKLLELEKTKAAAIQKDTEQAQTLKGLSREMNAINGALATELQLRNAVNDALSKPMKANQEITGTLKRRTTIEDGLFKAPTTGIMDTKLSDLGLSDVTSQMTSGDAMMAAGMARKKEQITQFNQDLNALIASGMQAAAVTFGVGIGNLMTGDMNIGEFGLSLLSAVAGFMVQFGEQMIALATANAVLALTMANPLSWPLMLAAGIAVVAAGTALANVSKKGMSGGSSGGGGSSAASGYSNQQENSTAAQALSGNVSFEVRGDKLVGVLNNVDRRNQNFK